MSYLNELEAHLHALPRDEREEMMAYYDEYFRDGNLSNNEARQQFGTPRQFARRLVADYYMNADDATALKPKKQLHMIWVVILAILASPVVFPKAIVVLALLDSLLAIVVSIVITIVMIIVSILVAAVTAIIAGFAVIFSSLTGGIFSIGVGLAGIGVLILVVPWFIRGIYSLFNGFVRLIKLTGRRFIKKGVNHEA